MAALPAPSCGLVAVLSAQPGHSPATRPLSSHRGLWYSNLGQAVEVQRAEERRLSCNSMLCLSYELCLWLRSNHSGPLPCLSWISTDNALAPHCLYCAQQRFPRQQADTQVSKPSSCKSLCYNLTRQIKAGRESQRGGVLYQGQNSNSRAKNSNRAPDHL